MDDDEIKQAIDRAQRLAEDRQEPFRSVAFWVLLDSFLKGRDEVHVAPPTARSAPAFPSLKPVPTNLNELLVRMKAQSHFDYVAGIAYHQFGSAGDDSVTVADIQNGYARARVRKPKNVYDVIRKSVQKGLLIESPPRQNGEKAWVITPTGEAYVNDKLQAQ
jgi:hypothetical protein